MPKLRSARPLRGVRIVAVLALVAVIATGCKLRTEADDAGILIGAGATNPAYLDDPQFAKVLGEQFNSLSPENELKWSFSEPQQGVFDFTKLDRLVEFADEHDMAVKGHGLISGCCNPPWLEEIDDPDELRAAMTIHFGTLMDRYDGKIDRWDVVTEALSIGGGSGLSPNFFYRVLGPDYIAEAFEIARAADPDAKLFLNESLVEYIPAKRAEFYAVVADLVDRGIPIDGVGLELHLGGSPPKGVITALVDEYHALGLEVAITELDVQMNNAAPNPLTAQSDTYAQVVSEYLKAGGREITMWGFTDKYVWIPGQRPLPYDQNFERKPAWYALWAWLDKFSSHPTS